MRRPRSPRRGCASWAAANHAEAVGLPRAAAGGCEPRRPPARACDGHAVVEPPVALMPREWHIQLGLRAARARTQPPVLDPPINPERGCAPVRASATADPPACFFSMCLPRRRRRRAPRAHRATRRSCWSRWTAAVRAVRACAACSADGRPGVRRNALRMDDAVAAGSRLSAYVRVCLCVCVHACIWLRAYSCTCACF
jgi:hypothetical protein